MPAALSVILFNSFLIKIKSPLELPQIFQQLCLSVLLTNLLTTDFTNKTQQYRFVFTWLQYDKAIFIFHNDKLIVALRCRIQFPHCKKATLVDKLKSPWHVYSNLIRCSELGNYRNILGKSQQVKTCWNLLEGVNYNIYMKRWITILMLNQIKLKWWIPAIM